MPHLTPVGGDHIGGGWQTGGAAELGHHFAAGEALLSAARIFRIGQHTLQTFTDADRLIQRPGPVWIEGDARLWEAFRQRNDRFGFFFTRQHPALQFEIVKTVLLVGRFRQTDHRIRGHRLFMAQAIPVALLIRLALVRQRGQLAVADEEQVAQHLNFCALLPITQQGGDVNAQMLTQQIEHRRFNTGHHVNSGAQVEGLQTAATRVTVGKFVTYGVKNVFIGAEGLPHHQRDRLFQCFTDLLATRDFTYPGVTGVIFDDHNITGEERGMGAAQVHQHAVMASNRDNLHGGHNRSSKRAHNSIL